MPVGFDDTPLLSGDFGVAVGVFVFDCLGIYALTGAVEGHLGTALALPLRPVYAALGVALLWPLTWPWHMGAAIAVLVILAWNVKRAPVH